MASIKQINVGGVTYNLVTPNALKFTVIETNQTVSYNGSSNFDLIFPYRLIDEDLSYQPEVILRKRTQTSIIYCKGGSTFSTDYSKQMCNITIAQRLNAQYFGNETPIDGDMMVLVVQSNFSSGAYPFPWCVGGKPLHRGQNAGTAVKWANNGSVLQAGVNTFVYIEEIGGWMFLHKS